MKKLELKPCDFPCELGHCPPGFYLYGDRVGFKTVGSPSDAFDDQGETFWGLTVSASKAERDKIIVVPLRAQWTEI